MRIESVTANAFGPLMGESLELAPGLTVIVGANESAKSSWHAAIYAGLCGRRRGRGATTSADRRFADLHRPWDGGDWRASVVVRLDDGRRVEITQDLGGRVDSRAMDVGLARDVSAEIMFEGCPDGSRWLGLDRDSFLATACINQAALLRVLEEAEGLQGHIASAAASAGTDANAATALAGIEDFFKEHVGRDVRGAARPLRRARLAVAEATAALTRALAAHEEYVAVVTEAEAHRSAAQQAGVELEQAQVRAARLEALLVATRDAAATRAQADRAQERAEAALAELEAITARHARAVELDGRFGGRSPTGTADDESLSRAASDALAGWRAVAAPAPLSGETALALRAQMAGTPEPPVGDLTVDPAVRQAASAFEQARAVLAAHSALRPADLLAVPELTDAVAATAAGGSRRGPTLLLGGSAVAGAAGLSLLVLGRPIPGLLAVVMGIALAGWALVRRAASAAEAESARARRTAFAQWSTGEQEYAGELARAETRLRRALEERGGEQGQVGASAVPVDGLFDQYEQACTERAAQAESAAQRSFLTQRLEERERLERAYTDARVRHEAAAAEVLRVATLVRSGDADATAGLTVDQAAGELDEWRERRASLGAEADEARVAWAELTALLDGLTLAELRARADEIGGRREALAGLADLARDAASEAERRRAELAAALPEADGAADVAAVQELLAGANGAVADRRALANSAASVADRAEGTARERAAGLASVAEAEERLAAEQAELDRVVTLAATLDLTTTFLRRAQDRVYRDIAPVLVRTLERWLPGVTGGRYVDAMVDPATLVVQVRGPNQPWRRADLLSVGTAEQVYLLLRVALAEALAVTGETCPLLLDDVTVQADPVRTARILDLLLTLAQDRQIVLFAQEPMVAQWAQAALTGDQHALIELEQVVTA